jgi:hypothetical protein
LIAVDPPFGQLRDRQRVGYRPVRLAVEYQPDVAAGHLYAIGVGDQLALPVNDTVPL